MTTHDIVVYDIEIVKCIPDRKKPNDPTLEYCGGWNDRSGMGISVLCAFDTREQMPRIFLADNLAEFGKLIEGRTVAGFNNQGFDDPLLAANGITVGDSYDLCYEMRAAVGEPRAFTFGVTKGGRRLDDLANANLGAQKSMHGDLAPVEWQRGNRGAVIDYCMRDVMLTWRLIEKLPSLIDPVTGKTVTLAMPQSAAVA